MAVTTKTRTDAQIQSDVLAELKWEPRVQPNEIGVVVKNGVAALTGWVDSYTKKWAAEDAAHRVRGVKGSGKRHRGSLSSSDERTDADLAATVVHALEWDAFVSVDTLDVTSKGWVTLKGEVEWQCQKQDAERVVRRLVGAVGVTNMITVRPRLAASELKQKIEKALIGSVETDAKRITVEVDGSAVIPKGTVRSWAERRGACGLGGAGGYLGGQPHHDFLLRLRLGATTTAARPLRCCCWSLCSWRPAQDSECQGLNGSSVLTPFS